MPVRILLLTFYYPPDLGAGSFRSEALARTLLDRYGADIRLSVLSAQPNRYYEHKVESSAQGMEGDGDPYIKRISVPRHRSGVFSQSMAFLCYAAGVLKAIRHERYDIVIATSSRMATAILGAGVAYRKRSKLYLDIRDIFAEIAPDVMPFPFGSLIKPVLSMGERWMINQADRINLVSPGFGAWFKGRYPGREFSYFTNGVDEKFIDPVEQGQSDRSSHKELIVLYAGNIGKGQGLHFVIPGLARSLEDRVRFRIIGAGGGLDALKSASSGIENIEILPPVERGELRRLYESSDILFLHLNRSPALTRVLPSKLFEYAAMGKPVWAGVSGYAKEFISSEIDNAETFPPCDINEAIRAFEKLKYETVVRSDFVEKYSRSSIMKSMADDVMELSGSEKI